MMWRAAVLVLSACGSAPSSTTSPTPMADPDPPKTPPSDPPIANSTPTPTPTPTTTTSPGGTPVARPCPRSAPIVFTIVAEVRTHEQLCTIVDDYITYLGAPSFRASGLALQFTATLTDGPPVACKITIDVHYNNKLLANVDGSAKAAIKPGSDVEPARQDCLHAVVNDQLARVVVPALARAGVTAPSTTPSTPPTGTGSGSGATP